MATAVPRKRAAALLAVLFQAAVLKAASLSFGFTLGGSQYDVVRAVATDAAKNVYIVGQTYSNDFPGASPAATRSSGDAFIVKLNSAGTQILYSIVFGGSGLDCANGVAVDANGNAYVTGVTESSDFPATAGSFQPRSASAGLQDAFIAKFSPSGVIVFASYLGGASNDSGYAIAVDSSGAPYVVGSTASPDFPISLNSAQTTFHGTTDCFIAKIDPAGAGLFFSTYLGGRNIDLCKGIAIDPSGNAIVAGVTASTDFPTANAFDGVLGGSYDAFVAKISLAGDRFLFSTYLGAEGTDQANAIAVGSDGVVYVAGDTTSTLFPLSAGALQSRNNGGYDGFLCAIANDGSAIQWATYLGGSGADSIQALGVAADGRIVVAGYTASADFPVVSPIQNSFGGGAFDAFLVAVARGNGRSLEFASFIGGSGDDRAFSVACLQNGRWIVAGQALSQSVSYLQQFSPAPGGQLDSFLAEIFDPQPLNFVAVTPCRVADTRNSIGPFGGPFIAASTSRSFSLPNSPTCNIPSGAQAYSLNVAVVPHSAMHYITIWPTGQTQPVVASLNDRDGRVKSNGAIIPAGINGAISVYSTDDTDVILDINGYFVPPGTPQAMEFYPVTPCRLVDTRNGTLLPGPFSAGQTRTVLVLSDACAIPSAAQAYSVNLTVVAPTRVGYLTAWPTGQPQPLVATLNAAPPSTVTPPIVIGNAAIVPAGAGGSINVFSTGATDLVIDINGYFAPPGTGGLSLYTLPPCRILDTRTSSGLFSGQLDVNLLGSPCGGTPQAQAYVFNATVVPPGLLGYLTMWPHGVMEPLASTLNDRDGTITNNMAIVPTTDTEVSAFVPNPTQLILDIFGYFAP